MIPLLYKRYANVCQPMLMYFLSKVTEDLVDRFNYVAGIVPVLTGYIDLVSSCVC